VSDSVTPAHIPKGRKTGDYSLARPSRACSSRPSRHGPNRPPLRPPVTLWSGRGASSRSRTWRTGRRSDGVFVASDARGARRLDGLVGAGVHCRCPVDGPQHDERRPRVERRVRHRVGRQRDARLPARHQQRLGERERRGEPARVGEPASLITGAPAAPRVAGSDSVTRLTFLVRAPRPVMVVSMIVRVSSSPTARV